MPTNIQIAENSNNEVFVVDMDALPHLFVSYTDEEQVSKLLLRTICRQNTGTQKLEVSLGLSNSRYFFHEMGQAAIKESFVAGDEYSSTVGTKRKLFSALSKELLLRTKGRKANANLLLSPRIIVLNDVFDFVLTSKHVGSVFLNLLVNGPSVGLQLILITTRTFRTLLKQLLMVHPNVVKQFPSIFASLNFSPVTELGAELVFTGDDLVFFKSRNEIQYQKLYPLAKASLLSVDPT